ncbi:MAG TPA: HAMP domain-containing protein, partial [Spirochaetia bacterium]|nr:HAMP domain-containing protein [Spirochaetia bacterium]
MTLCLLVMTATGVIIIEGGFIGALQAEAALSVREAGNVKKILVNSFLAEKYIDRVRLDLGPQSVTRSDTEIIRKTAKDFFSEMRSDIVILAFLDPDGGIISSSDNLWNGYLNRVLRETEFAPVFRERKGVVVERQIGARRLLFMVDNVDLVERHYVIALVRDLSFLSERRNGQYLMFVLLIAGALVVLGVILSVVSSRITRPIELLTENAQKIARGETYERVHVKSRDEIGVLARDFD